MIDTVILQIDLLNSPIQILESSYKNWRPHFNGLASVSSDKYVGPKTFHNNPTELDKDAWGYLPYLTLVVKNGGGKLFQTLYVQFSAPKLYFGNNFSELSDRDFSGLCLRIRRRLQLRGIYVPSDDLIAQCDVKHIDYCKNILYTDGTSPSSVIRLMHKSDISLHKNTNESKYKNGGESCNFYTLDECFCAYDKRKELQRSNLSKKGRLEKDNRLQYNLFRQLSLVEPFQVLRLEQRLEGKKAIKRMLVDTQLVSPNPTFKDLYNSTISKYLLTNKMHEIDANIPDIIKYRQDDISDFMECLAVLNPKIPLPLKLKALGARAVFNETGSRDFRKLIGATDKQWHDLMKDLHKLKMPKNTHTSFDEVYKQLEAFTPVKLEDHIDEMSNIDI